MYRGFESLFLRRKVAKKPDKLACSGFFDSFMHSPPQAGGMPRSGIPEEEGYIPLTLPSPQTPLLGRGARRQKTPFVASLLIFPPQAGGIGSLVF